VYGWYSDSSALLDDPGVYLRPGDYSRLGVYYNMGLRTPAFIRDPAFNRSFTVFKLLTCVLVLVQIFDSNTPK